VSGRSARPRCAVCHATEPPLEPCGKIDLCDSCAGQLAGLDEKDLQIVALRSIASRVNDPELRRGMERMTDATEKERRA